MVELALDDVLNISIFFIFVGVAIVPLYVSGKLGKTTLGLVSMVLGLFAVTHAFYHLSVGTDMYFLGATVFGPVSAALLFVFAVYFYRRGN